MAGLDIHRIQVMVDVMSGRDLRISARINARNSSPIVKNAIASNKTTPVDIELEDDVLTRCGDQALIAANRQIMQMYKERVTKGFDKVEFTIINLNAVKPRNPDLILLEIDGDPAITAISASGIG